MIEFKSMHDITKGNREITYATYRSIREVFFLEDRIIVDQTVSVYIPDSLMTHAMGHVSTTALKS